MNVINKCALTGVECDPVDSHIIPEFMFDYLRKDNGGLPFYWADNPMKEMKDGWKVTLLSKHIDQDIFGKWEKWSKNHIIDKIWKDESVKLDTKGPYFYNFILSLFWRILTMEIITIEQISSNEVLDFFKEKEESWRKYLADVDKTIPLDKIYFMPLNMYALGNRETTWAEKEWIRDNIGLGFYNEDINFAFYCKCPKCIFWVVLQGDFPRTYLGQEIHNTGDLLDLEEYIIRDDKMISFITSQVAKSKKKRIEGANKLTDKRKEKMAGFFLNDTFVKSESGQIIINRIREEYLEDHV